MNHVFFGIIWVLAQILRLLYRIEVKGLENLPRNGVLLCPNHASDLDPVLIGICLPINYRLHFMAKEELFQNRLFGRILRALGAFPVNREGADIQAVKTAMKVIHEARICSFSRRERPFTMAWATTTVCRRTPIPASR